MIYSNALKSLVTFPIRGTVLDILSACLEKHFTNHVLEDCIFLPNFRHATGRGMFPAFRDLLFQLRFMATWMVRMEKMMMDMTTTTRLLAEVPITHYPSLSTMRWMT